MLTNYRVITGVSGSPRNLPALRWAAALARARGAVLTLVLTWVPPGGEFADLPYPSAYLRQEWEQAAWQRLHDAMNMAFGGVPADLESRQLIARGEAGPVLVHTASQSDDVLVIGTGRRGTVSRLVGGNVSRYCLAHAGCPVLAIPPGSLEQQVRHGLSRRAFRHRGPDLSGLTV